MMRMHHIFFILQGIFREKHEQKREDAMKLSFYCHQKHPLDIKNVNIDTVF